MTLSLIPYPLSHRQRGQAIFPLVLVITMFLGIVGVTLAGAGFTQALLASQRTFAEQAREYAQSGVNDALLRVVRDKTWLTTGMAASAPCLADQYKLTFSDGNSACVSVTDASTTTTTAAGLAEYIDQGNWSTGPAGGDEGNEQLSAAVNPATNHVWVSFYRSSDGDNLCNDSAPWECSLVVAEYVGSGGTGCTNSTNPGQWNCTTVDSIAAITGKYTAIAVSSTGQVWVSYRDVTNTQLKAATNGPIIPVGFAACTASGWSCGVVDNELDAFDTDLALDPATGYPWISYYRDDSDGQPSGCDFIDDIPLVNDCGIKVAVYVFGNGAASGCSANWRCDLVWNNADHGGFTGTTIAFSRPSSGSAVAQVVFSGTCCAGNGIQTAMWVGAAGVNCSDAKWTCETVNNIGSRRWPSLAFDSGNHPWIAYWKEDTRDLLVAAKNVVTFGAACAGGAAGWRCDTVDVNGDKGETPSLVIHPSTNKPVVAYPYYPGANNGDTRLAVYRGFAGGNCDNDGGSDFWDCTTTDSRSIVSTALEPGLVFDSANIAWLIEGVNTVPNSSPAYTQSTQYSVKETIRRNIVATTTVRNVQRKVQVIVQVSATGGVQVLSRTELTS